MKVSYDYVGDGDATSDVGDENVNDDVMNVLVCAFSHVHEFNFDEFILIPPCNYCMSF
jgi:hypothetical protein